jgi:MFS family permease
VLLCESPRPTRIHYQILAFAFLGWMFDFYDLILYTFLVRPITHDLGFTDMDHSIALGISFSATAVGGIAAGLLADRFGRRALVAWTILIYSAGSLLGGLATGKPMLFFARAMTGIGVGGEWAAGHALVAETFPPAHRGRAGALLQAGAPVGVGLATLVGIFIAPTVGWRACMIASSATALLAFAVRRRMPESDVWLAGRAQKLGGGLARLFKGDRARGFYLAFALTTINGGSYWLTYSWLPEYLRRRGLSLSQSGGYLGLIVAGELIGYSIFGWVSDRIGRRPAFTIFALTMAAGLLPLSVLWNRAAEVPGLILAATMLVGIGTGTWSNFGPLLAELFPTECRTAGMGTVLNLSRGVNFVGPILIAALEPRYGLTAGVGLAAACATTAAFFVWTLPETRTRKLH